MTWACKIEKIQNGYNVSYIEEGGDEPDIERIFVFEEVIEESEICTISRMLGFVAEYFGIIYSDHNPENLIVKSSLDKKDYDG